MSLECTGCELEISGGEMIRIEFTPIEREAAGGILWTREVA